MKFDKMPNGCRHRPWTRLFTTAERVLRQRLGPTEIVIAAALLVVAAYMRLSHLVYLYADVEGLRISIDRPLPPPPIDEASGGLFLAFAGAIADNGYILPATLANYTDGGIPFAYPPLSFLLEAVLVHILGVPRPHCRQRASAGNCLASRALLLHTDARVGPAAWGQAPCPVRLCHCSGGVLSTDRAGGACGGDGNSDAHLVGNRVEAGPRQSGTKLASPHNRSSAGIMRDGVAWQRLRLGGHVRGIRRMADSFPPRCPAGSYGRHGPHRSGGARGIGTLSRARCCQSWSGRLPRAVRK